MSERRMGRDISQEFKGATVQQKVIGYMFFNSTEANKEKFLNRVG